MVEIAKKENEKNTMNTERRIELDYLRVFATFAVMIVHVSATNWYASDVNSFDWQFFNLYDAICRWCVPVFLMISGTFLLPKDIPLKVLYSKYIRRLLCAFIAWSFFYAVVDFAKGNGIASAAENLVKGPLHMWFVLMIIGIYMCIPFVKAIADKGKSLLRYYLILAFVFTLLLPQVVTLAKDFAPETAINIVNLFYADITGMRMFLVMGYMFYFILGYFVSSTDLSKKQRKGIYCVGAACFLLTIALSSYVSLKTQTPCENYYSYYTVNVFLESLSVFVAFKYHDFKNARINKIVLRLSKYSFGAYLVHAFVIDLLPRFGVNTLMCTPLIAVPFMGILVFVISFAISCVCNHIPVVKKYLV